MNIQKMWNFSVQLLKGFITSLLLLIVFSANSQTIVFDDSVSCGPNAQILWKNPTCIGEDNGIVVIRADTAAFNFPFEITILAGVLALPSFNGVQINPSGIDTFLNVPSTATSIIGQDNSFPTPSPLPCPFILNFVADPLPIVPTASFSNTINCFGETVDSLIGAPTNGVPPYNILWRNGATTGFSPSLGSSAGVILDVIADDYTLVITDANNCSDSTVINVEQPDTLIASSIISDVLCRGDATGSLVLNVSGGTKFTASPSYNYAWSNGLSNDSVQLNLAANLYAVTVTDSLNCVSEIDSIIISQPANNLIAAVSNFENISCFGGSDGKIVLTASGGTPFVAAPNYTFNWLPNVSSIDSAVNLTEGSYAIEVVDQNGCVDSVFQTITQPDTALHIVLLNQVDVACRNQAQGEISWSIRGGTAPYNISWSHDTAASDSSLQNLIAGNYIINVLDANGCVATNNTLLSQPLTGVDMVVVNTVNVTSCFGDTSGLVEVSVSNGTPPYQVTWPFGGASLIAINGGTVSNSVPGGNLTIIATDSLGCSTSVQANVQQPNPIQLNLSSSNTRCFGDSSGSAAVIASGGSTPGFYTFQWNDLNNSTTPIISNLPTGFYSVTVSDTAGNCLPSIDTISVGQPANPLNIDTVFTSQASCFNVLDGGASVSLGGGSPPYSPIIWSAGIPAGFGIDTARVNLPLGLNFAAVSDNLGCRDTVFFNITEPIQLATRIDTVQEVNCNNGNDGILSVSGTNGTPPYNYSWQRLNQSFTGNENFNSDNSIVSQLESGIYVAMIVDDRGCFDRDTVELINPTAIIVDFDTLQIVSCFQGADGIVEALPSGGKNVPGYNFLWSNGQTTAIGSNFNSAFAVVTVTDNLGLCPVVDSVFIPQNTQINASFIVNTLPDCDSANGSISVVGVSGGTPSVAPPFYTYQWIDTAATPADISENRTNLYQGLYEVRIFDDLGCSREFQFLLDNLNAPTIDSSIIINPTCKNASDGSIEVFTTGASTLSLQWNTGASSAQILNLDSGNYSLRIEDTLGCVRNQNFTLQDPDSLRIILNANDISCNGLNDGNIKAVVIGGIGPFAFTWSGGTVVNPDSIAQLNAAIYQVTVSDLGSNVSCQANAQVEIFEPNPLQINLIDSSLNRCAGTINAGFRFWSQGGTGNRIASVSPLPNLQINNNDTTVVTTAGGNYILTLSDQNNCSVSRDFNLQDPLPINISNVSSTLASCIGDSSGSATVQASGGVGTLSYQWNPNLGNQNTHSNLLPGFYQVSITDGNSCLVDTFVTVGSLPPINISFDTLLDVSCLGEMDGRAVLNVTGGSGVYPNITWTPTPNVLFPGLKATDMDTGFYQVRVDDSNGCFNTESFIIRPPSQPLAASIANLNPTICSNDSSGSLVEVVVTGGVAPVNYFWSGGDFFSTNTRINLPAGEFNVLVTDNNNCEISLTDTIVAPLPLFVQIDSTLSTCNQSNGRLWVDSISGSSGVYVYAWFDNNLNLVSNTDTASNLSAGLYFLLVQPVGCQPDTFAVILNDNSPTTLSDSLAQPRCFGDTDGFIQVLVNPAPIQQVWAEVTPSGLNVIGNGSSINNLAPGQYAFGVIDNLGCNLGRVFTIDDPDSISINFDVTAISCNGLADGQLEAFSTGGNPPYNVFNWTGPLGFSASLNPISGLSAGLYQLSVTDSLGCSNTASQTLTNPSLLQIDFVTVNNVSCNGSQDGAFDIGFSGGTPPYNFSVPNIAGANIFQTNNTIGMTNLGPNSFFVVVEDDNACIDSVQIDIIEPSALSVSANSLLPVTCFGGSDGFIELSVSGGTPGYQYLWSSGNPIPSVFSNSNNGLFAGASSVTVQDLQLCQEIFNFTIPGAASPIATTINILNSISCPSGSDGQVEVAITGGLSPYIVNWFDETLNLIDTGITINNLVAGKYFVFVEDSLGCSHIDSIFLGQPSAFNFSFTADTASCGLNDGAAQVLISGGTPIAAAPPYNISWLNSTLAGPIGTGIALNNVSSGNYWVEVIDDRNCLDTIGPIIIPDSGGPIVNIIQLDTPSCAGFNDGRITVAASGNGSFQYEWLGTSIQDSTILNVNAGNYIVQVTDASGCISFLNQTVVDPQVLTIDSFLVSDISCFGFSDGTAIVFASGGSGNFNYSWSNGDVSALTTGLNPSFWSVTVADQGNPACFTIDSVFISEPSIVQLAELSRRAPNCGLNDGEVIVIPSGGNGTPFTVNWFDNAGNFLQSGDTLSNAAQGIYAAVTLDANSCISDTLMVNLNNNAGPVIGRQNKLNISCAGSADGLLEISATGSNLQYNWSNGANTPLINNLTAGQYSLTVTDLNSNCVSFFTDSISAPDSLRAFISSTNVNCFGEATGEIDISVTGGTFPYFFQWNNAGLNGLSNVNNLGAGTYSVTILDSRACSLTENVVINENQQLQASLVVNEPNCGQSNGVLTASNLQGGAGGNYQFIWLDATNNPIAAAQTLTVNGLPSGSYQFAMQDSLGCSRNLLVALSDSGAPTIGIDTIISPSCLSSCNGGIFLDSSGTNLTYSWSNGSIQSFIDGVCSGVYTVTITDSSANPTCSKIITDTIPAATGINLSILLLQNPTCFGDSNGAAQAILTGGTGNYNYFWSSGEFTSTANGLSAGMNYITVTEVATGCSAIDSIFVSEGKLIILDSFQLSQPACGANDGSVRVFASGGNGLLNYQWVNGVTNVVNANLGAGIYNITVSDDSLCQQVFTTNLSNSGSGLVINKFSFNTSCHNTCDGLAAVNIVAGSIPYTINWYDAANNFLGSADTIFNLCAGIYSAEILSAGCVLVDTISIASPSPINARFFKTNSNCIVDNGSIIADISGGRAPYSYQWLDNNANPIIPQPGADTASGLSSGIYTILVTDANGCVNQYQQIVNDSGAPVISPNLIQNPSCNGVFNGIIDVSVVSNISYNLLWQPTADTNLRIENLGPGTYLVQVTDSANCNSFSSFNLVNNYNFNASLLKLNDPLCSNSADGAAFVAVSNGLAPYQYAWNNNSFTDTVNNLSNGMAVVTITDNNGCEVIDSLNMNSPSPIVVDSIQLVSPDCGLANGSITVFANGGQGPLSFLWNNGMNTSSINGITAGNYRLTITDSVGCSDEFVYPLSSFSPNPPSIFTQASPTTCLGSNDGVLSVNVVGAGSYSVLWPGIPSTQFTVNNVAPGLYDLRVFEQGSACVYTDTVRVQEATGFTINHLVNEPNCNQADGSVIVSVLGGNLPLSYLWLDENGLPLMPAQGSPTLNNVGAGKYIVNVVDANGCSQSKTIELQNIGGPSISIRNISQATCGGICDGSISLSASGLAPSFNWNTGATADSIGNLCAANYQVTVTDGLGCISFANYNISNAINFNANIIQLTNPKCFDSPDATANVVYSGGSGSYSVLWSSGETADTAISLSGPQAFVSVFDAIGCRATDTINLVTPTPIIQDTIQLSQPQCNICDGSISFTAIGGTGNLNYTWSNGIQSSLNANLCAGFFQLTVTDAEGCKSDFNVNLSNNNAPANLASSTENVSCADACDGKATAFLLPRNIPQQSFWPSLNLSTDSVANLCKGSYPVELTDSSGCKVILSLDISGPANINVQFQKLLPSCGDSNGVVTAIVDGGVAPYSYNWTDSAGNNIGSDSASLRGLPSGFYSLKVVDANNCNYNIDFNLSDRNGPTVNLLRLKNSTCNGICDGEISIGISGFTTLNWSNDDTTDLISNLCPGTYQLTARDTNGCLTIREYKIASPRGFNLFVSNVNPSTCDITNDGSISIFAQGSSTLSYEWSGPQNYIAINQNIANLFPGTYTVVATDPRGCIEIDSATITAKTVLSVRAFGDTSLCFGDTNVVRMTGLVSGQFNNLTLAWSDEVNRIISTGRAAGVIPRPGAIPYVFTAFSNGCIDRDTVVLRVNGLDSVFAGNDREIIVGDEVVLGGNPTARNADTYLWTPDVGLNSSSSPNPIAKPSITTTYRLVVRTADGCTTTDSVMITVIDEIRIRNAFSPNSDGVNDFWELDFLMDYPQSKVQIFNRWGQLLYESVGYANPWDGRFEGQDLPVGTYYYIIEVNDGTTKFETLTGTVTIVK